MSWCGRCVTAVHTGILNRTAFSYDNAGRLDTVTALDSALSSLGSASYGYPANSRLVSQIAFTNTNTRRMLTSKSYDNLDRLTSIASATNSSAIAAISYAYGYNSANQRTAVTAVRWVLSKAGCGYQPNSGKTSISPHNYPF